MRTPKRILIVSSMLAISACGSEQTLPGAGGIQGNFSALVHVKPNSLEAVRMDIYEDFTCPACQRLEEIMPDLQARYGSRLIVQRHYLAGPATPPSAKLLYDVAHMEGMGKQVAKALFAAKLDHGSDKENEPVVLQIAKSFSLEDKYLQAKNSGKGLAKVQAEWKKTNDKVPIFPFVVIEQDIAADANLANLQTVMDSLLTDKNVKNR